MNSIITLITFLGIWNLITFALMGIDKYKAIKNRHRISEKSLFLCAFLLGGIGIICGMYAFRHKTRHLSFKIFVPVSVIANIILVIFYFKWNV